MSLRVDPAQQLRDIYAFEQALRNRAHEVHVQHTRYKVIFVALIIWNILAVAFALWWNGTPSSSQPMLPIIESPVRLPWRVILKDLLIVYTPLVVGGVALVWVWITIQFRHEDSPVYIARCNLVLKMFNTYFCLDKGKIFILKPTPQPAPMPIPTPPSSPLPPSTHAVPGLSNRLWQTVTGARGGLLSGATRDNPSRPPTLPTPPVYSSQTNTTYRRAPTRS
eukprot:TRINITY_DN6764_c0_g1_i2.p1 TRINITY_DN6764_c0_g1~~TRINITY_DN6764_c0_g1_i2.p1  ORF type:complete len:222 (+),score=11.29 TRINITY_DN6764_c0_g1_i2:149-814(+)